MLVQWYSVFGEGGINGFHLLCCCFQREYSLPSTEKFYSHFLFSFYTKFLMMLLEIFESFSNKVFLKIFWMAKLLNSRVPSFVGTVKCSISTNGTLFWWRLGSWLCWFGIFISPLTCNWSLKCSLYPNYTLAVSYEWFYLLSLLLFIQTNRRMNREIWTIIEL